MAKKQFDLNKGGQHKFDLDKGTRRTFDLKKDTPEAVPVEEAPRTPPQAELEYESTPDAPKKQSPAKWFIILAALIVIALLIWWFWPSKGAPENELESTATEEVVPADSAATDTVVSLPTEEATAAEAPVAAETVEAPAPAATTETAESAAAPAPASTQASATASTPETTSTEVSGDLESEVNKVIRGDYGNNPVRRKNLGSRYREIQKLVNEKMRR